MQTIFLAGLRSHTGGAVLQVREVLERDKFKLLQEAESAEATQRAMEKELAKYDNDLAIELTFRTRAERSVALAVERMAANATESWLERAFYCWARRTASNHVRTTTLLSCAESTPILRCACCLCVDPFWAQRAEHVVQAKAHEALVRSIAETCQDTSSQVILLRANLLRFRWRSARRTRGARMPAAPSPAPSAAGPRAPPARSA